MAKTYVDAVEATIYHWPYSQNCLDCLNGKPLMDSDMNEVACLAAEKGNDGETCPSKKTSEADPGEVRI